MNSEKLLKRSAFRYHVYADLLAVAVVALELYNAGDLRVKGVVLADADVRARVDLGAPLPYEYAAAGNELALIALYAKPLCI